MQAVARKTDPITSHRAADKAQKKVKPDSQLVLEAVRQYPGLTMPELAAKSGVSYEIIHRRMSGLKEAGLVKYKDVGGRFVEVWPVQKQFKDSLFD